ncbi:rod shape-determining protein RodA [Clostridium sp. 19966]|uniref:rod shape-determining protein RodA n=1 Tax=Clostridium sp. 19966 TaxID=2768166 RepID=UPI0028E067BB|nr:rod shape-determining protein RodA [Clostridium sp. 19966]MDT8715278.1 rod shape-determining protein RodA [Clostridium sp. 19966]
MLQKLILERKFLRNINFGILFIAILIVGFGCLNIYAAVGGSAVKLQIAWLLISLLFLYAILLIDSSTIMRITPIFYWANILLLIYVDLFGNVVNGARGWIGIGSRALQPSEFAKVAMIMMLAKKLDDMEGKINNIKNFFILAFYAIIPMGLIVIQPDMGMTMVSFFIVLGIFFIAGLDLRIIFGGITALVALVAVLWNSSLMEAYWKKRLTIFLHPESDQLGAGLQLIQSMTGIGSGGIFGNGVKTGTKAMSGFVAQFVPENNTDFIFAMVGEKWGFIGGTVLLFLYFLLLAQIIRASKKSKDLFGSLVCIGVFSSLLFSIIENIGMTIGVMPITGITLPFMSSGGSSMLSNFIALGLIMNIGMRSKKINFI